MKPRKTSNLTVFAILTTLALLTWVLIEGYLRFKKPPELVLPAEVSAPLTPSLDTAVLDTIEGRRFFSPEEVAGFVPPVQVPPTPAPESSPAAAETSQE